MSNGDYMSEMSLIEGVGDEILQFFACVFIAFIITSAWFSTVVTEVTLRPRVLAFILWLQRRSFERRTRRSSWGWPTDMSNTEQQSYIREESIQDLPEAENTVNEEYSNSTEVAGDRENNDVTNLQETADGRTEFDATRRNPRAKQRETFGPNGNPREINKRLKYLNDTETLTRGYLHETIGEFKRRHFNTELSQGKKIVMIFSSRILNNDELTIGGCGIFDYCVVHLLIRPFSPVTTPGPMGQPVTWRYLLTSWGMILGGLWYSRYFYGQMFSGRTTVGLLVISSLYLGCLVSFLLPELEARLVPDQ